MAARRGGTPAGRGGASSGRGRHSGNSTRGAARTSKPVRTGGPRRMIEDKKGAKAPVKEKGLGGEQVEGRQAVRELLIAQRRKVREIWMAADIDTAPIIEDIEELAHAQRVTVLEVPRRTR